MSATLPMIRLAAGRLKVQAEALIVATLVLIKIGVHLLLADRYGYHRDEYYFIDCGRHLAFGYVDHAPLVPWLARLSTELDDSIVMLRLPSILAGGATVWLTMRLARRFGAGLYGQALAGFATLFAPAYLRMHGMLDIPAFEPVFWTIAAHLIMDLLDGARRTRWLLIGLVAGVGLLNKHTMLLWGAGIVVGTLATPLRADLKTKWPWLGALVALLIFCPNLIWQAQNGWPTLEFIQHMRESTLAKIPRPLFLAGQLLYMHPLAAPIWIAGLVCLFSRRGKRYRVFAWLYVTVMIALLALRAKPYYAAPAYPALFAAGAMQLEEWLRERTVGQAVFGGAFIAGGIVLGAVTLPIFNLDRVDSALEASLGWVVRPIDLTHDMHDEHGWPEQSLAVAKVFEALSPEERVAATIFVGNYGEASALNFHGPALGLPRATSRHMTHYLWGPDHSRPGPLIVFGVRAEELSTLCQTPEEIGRIEHDQAMETDLPIYLCRRQTPLAEIWDERRRYHHGRVLR